MCKLIFVSLLVVAAAFSSVLADDLEAQANATDVPTGNSSNHGGSVLDVCRTSFNNPLLINMLKRAIGLTPLSDPRPSEIALTITVPANAQCVNRLDNGAFTVGIRVDPDQGSCNNAVLGLYDINGKLSGIQIRFPFSESKDLTGNNYNYSASGNFLQETIDGKKYYVITAYFVHPSKICVTGRTTSGPLEQLYFQNGTSPIDSNLMMAPSNRADAIAQNWTDNNCFPGMGKHNFNNVQSWAAKNCTELKPFFLLYNDDDNKLTGFGCDWVGMSKNCRFEQPPIKAIELIVGKEKLPQCLRDYAGSVGVTTMHVFFTKTDQTCKINLGGLKTFWDIYNFFKSFFGNIFG